MLYTSDLNWQWRLKSPNLRRTNLPSIPAFNILDTQARNLATHFSSSSRVLEVLIPLGKATCPLRTDNSYVTIFGASEALNSRAEHSLTSRLSRLFVNCRELLSGLVVLISSNRKSVSETALLVFSKLYLQEIGCTFKVRSHRVFNGFSSNLGRMFLCNVAQKLLSAFLVFSVLLEL